MVGSEMKVGRAITLFKLLGAPAYMEVLLLLIDGPLPRPVLFDRLLPRFRFPGNVLKRLRFAGLLGSIHYPPGNRKCYYLTPLGQEVVRIAVALERWVDRDD